MFMSVIMQSLSQVASHEKNMQLVAEHALHEKLMSRGIISCVATHCLCYCLFYMAVISPENESLISVSYFCVSVLIISFRSLFHAPANSTVLRW
jgi:hypothetical protein